jgi:hypothetical protein
MRIVSRVEQTCSKYPCFLIRTSPFGGRLQLLETHGGEDAFINIKYMIPTYESCVLN